MTAQDRIQFLIGQLTVSNMSLQEKVEQLEKENAELRQKNVVDIPPISKLKEVSKES